MSRKYRIGGAYSYDEYDACLEQVDAVYIALPNSMHAEYTIRAANAGVHVLSDCILKNREPEPSGEEGLQDVRIVRALHESAESGKAVSIPPFERSTRPTGRQRITRPGVRKPELVNVQSASED